MSFVLPDHSNIGTVCIAADRQGEVTLTVTMAVRPQALFQTRTVSPQQSVTIVRSDHRRWRSRHASCRQLRD
jgi:hypothetical protein